MLDVLVSTIEPELTPVVGEPQVDDWAELVVQPNLETAVCLAYASTPRGYRLVELPVDALRDPRLLRDRRRDRARAHRVRAQALLAVLDREAVGEGEHAAEPVRVVAGDGGVVHRHRLAEEIDEGAPHGQEYRAAEVADLAQESARSRLRRHRRSPIPPTGPSP